MPPLSEKQAEQCKICKRALTKNRGTGISVVREPIQALISKENPAWDETSRICDPCLNNFRTQYVQDLLKAEQGEITRLEKEVLESLVQHETLAENLNKAYTTELKFTERISDRIATFGGSWTFILLFLSALGLWMLWNFRAQGEAFDPYPFILLNLILSCIAALQAPVIMMSQNRQDAKDRIRNEHDYQTNLKAELEIRQLHMKIDQLLKHQWQRMLELQALQVDLLEAIKTSRRS
jgi:uncharacterized membrane protein